MGQTDVAIVGGGLAGSAAAAMRGRAGIDCVLVDPHTASPFDFRCEKLDASQIALLRQTGFGEAVFRVAAANDEVWVARFGRLVDRRPNRQCGILYDSLVNTVRSQIAPSVPVIPAKAAGIATGPDRQTITLSTGETISARLLVLANGLNSALRQGLGMGCRDLSRCHSISIGFDMRPVGRQAFEFRALTYFPERIGDHMAYLTLFPTPSAMRANLFVYRDMDDLWLREFRQSPQATLTNFLPRLARLTGEFEVTGAVKIRPVDLYVTEDALRSGVVLVGDAFATSCPAAGTGVNKVLTDVVRLCGVHIPRWLQSPGMGADKVAGFYADPVKVACDRYSIEKAFYLRSLSTETGSIWRMRRGQKFLAQFGVGAVRRLRAKLAVPRPALDDHLGLAARVIASARQW